MIWCFVSFMIDFRGSLMNYMNIQRKPFPVILCEAVVRIFSLSLILCVSCFFWLGQYILRFKQKNTFFTRSGVPINFISIILHLCFGSEASVFWWTYQNNDDNNNYEINFKYISIFLHLEMCTLKCCVSEFTFMCMSCETEMMK